MTRIQLGVLLVALALGACQREGGEGGAGDRDTLAIELPSDMQETLDESLEEGGQAARRGAQRARRTVGEAVEGAGRAIEEAGEDIQE